MRYFTTLTCIGYNVTVADNQVIFTQNADSQGFTLERPRCINNSNGIWWLSDAQFDGRKIPVSHVVEAAKWCEAMFGKNFEPYKRELK